MRPSVPCLLLAQLVSIGVCEAIDLTTGSLLGLQRGFTVQKVGATLPAAAGVRSAASGSHKLQQGALRQGSLLGLQRGFQVKKAAPAASVVDEDSIASGSHKLQPYAQRQGS